VLAAPKDMSSVHSAVEKGRGMAARKSIIIANFICCQRRRISGGECEGMLQECGWRQVVPLSKDTSIWRHDGNDDYALFQIGQPTGVTVSSVRQTASALMLAGRTRDLV